MKAKYIGLMGMLLAGLTVSAQTSKPGKVAYNDERNNNYDRVRNTDGKRVEEMQMNRNGKVYKAEFVNDKMTALAVDGENIPAADWSEHADAIAAIRQQIKQNQEQARLNAIQAKKNEEQDARNAQQAKRNEEQARLNEVQVKHNEEQAKQNQVQAEKNQLQAKRNEEQDARNAEQAKRNEEQAKVNELQAKKNEEQAAENERFIKQFTEDLVSDKIIADKNSLHEFTLNSSELTVNGVKQPDAVFKKYKEKFSKQASGQFSYSRDGYN